MSSNSKPSAACWALRLKKSDEPNDIFTNVAKVISNENFSAGNLQMYHLCIIVFRSC
jgi:hypothetical protein